MDLTRSMRKALTFAALKAMVRVSQRAKTGRVIEVIRHGMLTIARTAVPIRRRLARNMRAAGVYREGLLDAHFRRSIDQLCMIAHVVRAGVRQSGCLERFRFDETFLHVEQAWAAKKGVIHIAPHICGYPLYASIVSPRIPCCAYLRRNADPRKRRIDEEVTSAWEGEIVAPPRQERPGLSGFRLPSPSCERARCCL